MSNRFLKTFLLVLTGVAVGGWVVGVVVYTLNSSGEKKVECIRSDKWNEYDQLGFRYTYANYECKDGSKMKKNRCSRDYPCPMIKNK